MVEGYGRICGFKTDDAKEIRTHVMLMSAQDGKGTHKSLGRINLQTGEPVLPPWKKERKSTYGEHGEKHARQARTGSTRARHVQCRKHSGGTIAPPTNRQKRQRGRTRSTETTASQHYRSAILLALYATSITSEEQRVRLVKSDRAVRSDAERERRAGEILVEMEKNRGVATSSHDVTTLPPKLEKLGISHIQSHYWQLGEKSSLLKQSEKRKPID